MISYGNRGKALEKQFNKYVKLCQNRGIFAEQNHPEVLHDGTYKNNHGFDYTFFKDGVFYAVDAKNCDQASLGMANLKTHQVNAMMRVVKNKGEAFFAIYFSREKKLIRLNAEKVVELLQENKKTIKPEDGVSMVLNFLEIK